MTDGDKKMTLPNLEGEPLPSDLKQHQGLPGDGESVSRSAADLEAVFDVPVQVSAVLGRSRMDVGQLLKLGPLRCSSLIARSAKPSTSTSTIAW